MEKKGYNVVTTSTDVNIGDLFSTKTEAVLVCSKEVDGKTIVVTAAFYKDAEEAKARYEKVKAENEKELEEQKEALKKAETDEEKEKEYIKLIKELANQDITIEELRDEEKERINEKIASLKDFKLKRSGKILVFGNKKAVNDYTGL
mgnify:CR=1 FL=1